MNLLVRNALIADPRSSHHGQRRDVWIEKGVISKILKPSTKTTKSASIEGDQLCISPAWMDTFAFLGEPGQEHRETIKSGLDAAAHGGFGHVVTLPNTQPSISDAAMIKSLLSMSAGHIVTLLPMMALTQNCQGEKIAEMMDAHKHGAVIFGDGLRPVQNAGLFRRVSEYLLSIPSKPCQLPLDLSLSAEGQMNEGKASVKYGLSGIPKLAESLIVHRDIELSRYTGNGLHISAISCPESLEIIKKARKRGQDLSVAVSPMHLLLDDSMLGSYDTVLKLPLALRSTQDRKKLLKGVLDGSIDMVTSMHIPVHEDDKKVEFDRAEAGMISFQTVLPLLLQAGLAPERIAEVLSIAPKRTFGIENPSIEKGNQANMTIFDLEETWVLDEQTNKSKSKNSYWWGKPLQGRVKALIQNNKTLKI